MADGGGIAAYGEFFSQGTKAVTNVIRNNYNNGNNNNGGGGALWGNNNNNNSFMGGGNTSNNNNNNNNSGLVDTLVKASVVAVGAALAWRYTGNHHHNNNNSNSSDESNNNNRNPQQQVTQTRRGNNNNNQNQNQNQRNNNNNNRGNFNPGSPTRQQNNNNNQNQQQQQQQHRRNTTNNNQQQQHQPQPRRVGNSPWMNIAVLGQGANGVVYKGMHMETGQIVAIKEMLNAAGDRELRREMEILRHLNHPNLVGIHAFEVIAQSHVAMRGSGSCRLVMDLCGNGTLIDILKQTGAVPEARLRTYARQLLSGLRALHENDPPIIHRDLKPANILVDEMGTLKIADFGLSRYANSMRDITRLAGTPLYLAPESVRGHFSVGSDLWAVGATLIQLVTGKLPWDGVAPMDNNASLMFFLSNVPTDAAGKRNHHPAWPDTVSDECKDFFKTIFSIDHQLRGTCRSLLTRHPWLANGEEEDEEDEEEGDEEMMMEDEEGEDNHNNNNNTNSRNHQRTSSSRRTHHSRSGTNTSGGKTTNFDEEEYDEENNGEYYGDGNNNNNNNESDEEEDIYDSSDFQSTESSLPTPPPRTN